MSLRVAIIADDLTGALDTGTPFVLAGLSVAVAVDVADATLALESGADVVVINTASRGLAEAEAVARAAAAARHLARAKPVLVMKKIDSRLKGHVAAESAAIAAIFGARTVIVAPAVPDQGRVTQGGHVTGRGVDTPLPIGPLFAGHALDVDIADAASDIHLDAVAARPDLGGALLVGARGIGAALARRIGSVPSGSAGFEPSERTLYAFGSRDPITMAQMDRLLAYADMATILDAPMGILTVGDTARLPGLMRCTGDMTSDTERVAHLFAQGVALMIDITRPDVLMVGGGDTALAVFRALGIRVLVPGGEIEPGVPWCAVTTGDGRRFRCVVKSGGFGSSNSLLKLLKRNHAA